MFPADRLPIPVVVEFDHRGQRTQRRFPDSHAAKTFFVRMHRARRHPRIVQAGEHQKD